MRKSLSLLILAFAFCFQMHAQDNRILPTQRQAEWADAELGVLLHYDLPCFEGYDKGHPDAKIFNPDRLDTDQWVRTVKKMGAKYIVMIAKHGTGFSLWPTAAHDCSVKSSPWKNGHGDVIAEFIASCKKYGIKPGIYYCTHCNDYCGIDHHKVVGSMTQEEYNEVLRTQLTELWGNYGELFEVWFDGGIKPASQGGFDVKPLLESLQPNAIAFQGPTGYAHLIRWVGNEDGLAPDPCWSTTNATSASDGVDKVEGLDGKTNGKIWCPGESDCTLRSDHAHAWMFEWAHQDATDLFSIEEMMEKYETSVGRNTNMLVGLVIDNHGVIPEADVRRAVEFGREIKRRYGKPSYSLKDVEGSVQQLSFKKPCEVDRCIIQEDITKGERVRRYILEGTDAAGNTVILKEGQNIGHKRIIRFKPQNLQSLRLTVTESDGTPQIRNFSVFSLSD